MEEILLGIAALIIGYLVGAFPTAYIITKLRKGIDIRDVDIGNVGGGSVLRQVGVWEGILVIAVDMAKGAAAILIAQIIVNGEVTILIAQSMDTYSLWVLGAGFTAIIGHDYPVYIGFRGGQGVATIMGIFFVITPVAMAIPFLAMGVVLLITRRKFARILFVTVCIISPLLPISVWIIYKSEILLCYTVIIVILLLFKNRRRLNEIKTLKRKSGTDT